MLENLLRRGDYSLKASFEEWRERAVEMAEVARREFGPDQVREVEVEIAFYDDLIAAVETGHFTRKTAPAQRATVIDTTIDAIEQSIERIEERGQHWRHQGDAVVRMAQETVAYLRALIEYVKSFRQPDTR